MWDEAQWDPLAWELGALIDRPGSSGLCISYWKSQVRWTSTFSSVSYNRLYITRVYFDLVHAKRSWGKKQCKTTFGTMSNKSDRDSESEPKDYGKRGFLTHAQQKNQEIFLNTCDRESLEMARYTLEDPGDTALRFLRSRKFVVDKALILLNENKVWRIANKAMEAAKMTPNEAGQCDIDVVKTFYPHTMRGMSKDNCPIVWEMTGEINPQAVMTIMTRETLLAYHFWTMQTNLDNHFKECANLPPLAEEPEPASASSAADAPKLPECSDGGATDSSDASMTTTTPMPPTEPAAQYSPYPIATTAILDLNGFGLAQCGQKTMDQIKLYINTDNTCYPETLGKMLVINAPYLISSVWGIIKGWLDPRTVTKIEIISSTDASLKRLHELIDSDNLPKQYGGTAPDLFVSKPNTEMVWVSRGGEHVFEIMVPAGHSLTIDNYVNEGSLEYMVESRVHPTEAEKKAEGERKAAEKKGWWGAKYDPGAAVTFESLAYLPTKKHTETGFKIRPTENKEGKWERVRHLDNLSAADLAGEDRAVQVRITWTNNSRMSQRPLVFACTVHKPGAETRV